MNPSAYYFSTFAIFAGFLAYPADSQAAKTITLTGKLTAQSPTALLPGLGQPPWFVFGGTRAPYAAFRFKVSVAGTYIFFSSCTGAKFDNYTALYTTKFIPAAPLKNLLITNDDLESGDSGFAYRLNTDTEYIFINTTYHSNEYGAFNSTITGPGNVLPSAATGP